MTDHSRGCLLLKLPALYDNKYVIFYSLWPCYFIPSLNLVVYTCCFASQFLLLLSWPALDLTISSSSSDDENYDGLLECAHKLAGETSDKSSMEGGMQGGVSQVLIQVSSQVHRISQFLKWLMLH